MAIDDDIAELERSMTGTVPVEHVAWYWLAHARSELSMGITRIAERDVATVREMLRSIAEGRPLEDADGDA